jgi:2-polyprenyl-3-methyl-5-hydroxy-6-metoxy-1,4-benzoquinol methylase
MSITEKKVSPIIINSSNQGMLKRFMHKIFHTFFRPLSNVVFRQQDHNIYMQNKVQSLQREIINLNESIKKLSKAQSLEKFDYVQFENYFRGDEGDTAKKQSLYLEYFPKKGKILDIGCGRGEFLDLLNRNGFTSVGVDINMEMVNLCLSQGLEVYGEGFESFLQNYKGTNFDGIFSAQVIEHLNYSEIIELVELSHHRLNDKGILILETLNVKTLFPHLGSFYADPTHVNFIYPETLKFICQRGGFSNVEIIYINKCSKEDQLKVDSSASEVEKENIKKLNELIYGYQDFAILARK